MYVVVYLVWREFQHQLLQKQFERKYLSVGGLLWVCLKNCEFCFELFFSGHPQRKNPKLVARIVLTMKRSIKGVNCQRERFLDQLFKWLIISYYRQKLFFQIKFLFVYYLSALQSKSFKICRLNSCSSQCTEIHPPASPNVIFMIHGSFSQTCWTSFLTFQTTRGAGEISILPLKSAVLAGQLTFRLSGCQTTLSEAMNVLTIPVSGLNFTSITRPKSPVHWLSWDVTELRRPRCCWSRSIAELRRHERYSPQRLVTLILYRALILLQRARHLSLPVSQSTCIVCLGQWMS